MRVYWSMLSVCFVEYPGMKLRNGWNDLLEDRVRGLQKCWLNPRTCTSMITRINFSCQLSRTRFPLRTSCLRCHRHNGLPLLLPTTIWIVSFGNEARTRKRVEACLEDLLRLRRRVALVGIWAPIRGGLRIVRRTEFQALNLERGFPKAYSLGTWLA